MSILRDYWHRQTNGGNWVATPSIYNFMGVQTPVTTTSTSTPSTYDFEDYPYEAASRYDPIESANTPAQS